MRSSWPIINLELDAGRMSLWLLVLAGPGQPPKVAMRLDTPTGYARVSGRLHHDQLRLVDFTAEAYATTAAGGGRHG